MKLRPLEPIVVALCLLSSRPTFGQALDPAAPPTINISPDLLLVEITVNGALQEGQFLVARQGGLWLLRAADVVRLRIIAGSGEGVEIEGDRFVSLPPATSIRFDGERQRLLLKVPPDLFQAQQLSAAAGRLRPTPSAFAAFLNYDVAVEHHAGIRASGFFEAGMSDSWGLIASTFAVGEGLGSNI